MGVITRSDLLLYAKVRLGTALHAPFPSRDRLLRLAELMRAGKPGTPFILTASRPRYRRMTR